MQFDRTADVVILGGGPAGSTCASILRRHHPALRVLVVEQEAFPRHHVGESLIIEANRILAEMGALDAVASAGFMPKGGATFVWGRDREPWSLRFPEASRLRPDPQRVFDHTWHVERGRYDSLLLEVARQHGAEVLQPARARELMLDADERVIGVRIADATGVHAIGARFVIDAGGRGSLVARRFGTRVFDPVLRNVATYGYWRGAALEERYSGTRDRSLIVVVSIPGGWIWYIPVRPDVVSVGVVTPHATFAARDRTVESLYHEHIAHSPEVQRWLAGASLVRLDGAARDVLTEQDFNYAHDRLAGPGWALVGDAGGFVDPLFSIGVFLAQSSARHAAYVIGTLLSDDSGLDEARLLAAYDQHARAQLDAFRAMAYVFYAFNHEKEEWWSRTRALLRSQALPDDIEDREAFIALTFGFGVNATLFQEAIQCFGAMAGPQIRNVLLDGTRSGVMLRDYDRTPMPSDRARPRLVRAVRAVPSAVPVDGTGRVVPMTRLEIGADDDARGAAFPRQLYVPDALATLHAEMDGTASLGALVDRVRSLAPAGVDPRPFVRHLVRSLVGFRAAVLEEP